MSNVPARSNIRRPHARQHLSLLTTSFGPLLGLVVVIGFFAMMDTATGGGTFMSAANLRTIAVQTSTVAVAALGMTVIIIAGGIDLSAGTALSLCATVIAYCLCRLLRAGGDRFGDRHWRSGGLRERRPDQLICA